MRICFLAGAISIHTVRWVNAMAQRGHEVHLITMHPPLVDEIEEKVKLYRLPFKAPLGYYLNFFHARRLIKEIRPDILNTHYASGYGTLSRLIKFHPTLLSVWGSDVFDFPYKSDSKKSILKKNLWAATRIASTSFVMKEEIEKFYKPYDPIEVTPFGVDMNKFKPLDMLKSGKEIYIGTVKTLEETYGLKYLVEGFYHLLKRLNEEENPLAQDIRLLIVGKGSQESFLKGLVQDLGINKITEFTGAIPHEEVPLYLNKLDIYCAPSIQESFGVAVIEASACEVPVIVSDTGGLPEVVLDNQTGFVVKPKDSLQIAEKLYQLVLDPKRRSVLGKNGRQYVNSKFSWEENVTHMENIYKSLIKRNEA